MTTNDRWTRIEYYKLDNGSEIFDVYYVERPTKCIHYEYRCEMYIYICSRKWREFTANELLIRILINIMCQRGSTLLTTALIVPCNRNFSITAKLVFAKSCRTSWHSARGFCVISPCTYLLVLQLVSRRARRVWKLIRTFASFYVCRACLYFGGK